MTMRTFICLPVILFPCLASAATDCHIVEYPERFEAVCLGEPQAEPTSVQKIDSAQQVRAAEPG